MSMHEKLARLEERRAKARLGGGEARLQAQHQKGKLSARERLDLLLDDDSFVEMDRFVTHRSTDFGLADKKVLEIAVRDLTTITGQKPAICRARKSVSNFKLREGQAIGCSVTLRGTRQWEFLDRLLNVALPRVRDFSGVSPKAFDGRGNYAMGLKEQIIFPEISYDQIDKVRGMDIIICTTAKTDAEAKALLKHFNMPFNS